MNILIINYEYPPLGGGGGSFARDLAEELAKKHNVDVLTSGFKDLKKEEISGGVRIFRVPVAKRRSLYSATIESLLSFPFTSIPKGISLVKKKKYDVINTHFAVPTGPAGVVISYFSGVPNVLSLHGSDIYNPVRGSSPEKHAVLRWAVRCSLKEASRVIANSQAIKTKAENIYRPGRKIDIVPLGMRILEVLPPDRGALSMKPDGLYLTSIGRMAKVKGYGILIKAVKVLKEKGIDVHLILIGDGPQRKALQELSEKLGLSSSIKFTGWLESDEKFKFLAASDIYVMSSIHEGFGVVLLEAMAAGVPIIATDQGGQTDIIKDSRSGILIPPGKAEKLAEAVLSLAKDPKKRENISTFNKSYVKEYDISRIAERYLDIFNEAINSKVK